jgi:hypothetical protein
MQVVDDDPYQKANDDPYQKADDDPYQKIIYSKESLNHPIRTLCKWCIRYYKPLSIRARVVKYNERIIIYLTIS